MVLADPAKLTAAKQRLWFYPFELPDGTLTRSYIPARIAGVHATRLRQLRAVIARKVANPRVMTAIDLASHEGFFAIELAKHFSQVRGYEMRGDSIAAARLMTELFGVANIEYVEADLGKLSFDPALRADFVLVYGLIYHLEDPIGLLRLASRLCRTHILVETQVFPYDISGMVENGAYDSQRPVAGVFALTADNPASPEGGTTELALVPSLNALLSLLRGFGFAEIEVLPPAPGDYEQFRRGSRVIVYGRKQAAQAG